MTSSDWRVSSSVDSGVQTQSLMSGNRMGGKGTLERGKGTPLLFFILRVKQVIFPCNYFSQFEQRSPWKETYQVLNYTLKDSRSHIASVRRDPQLIVLEPMHLASQTASITWEYSNLSDIDCLGEGTCFKHLPMIIVLLRHDELERLYWKSYGS